MHTASYDTNGLVVLTLTQVLENLKESVFNAGELGPEVSTGDHTVLGMHLKSDAIEISYLWDMLNDIVAAWDPDSSEGVQQDNVNRLRGAVRHVARASTATVTCTGVNGTAIAIGSVVGIGSDGEQWTTDAAAAIPVGLSVDVAVTASNTGAVEAAIGAINTIITTTAGWNSVTNAAEAVEGEAVETDADYRLRSENTGTGTTTEEAVYTRLGELDDVDAVVVTSNRTTVVDALGTNPHTMWIVLYPSTADTQDIAEAIWGGAGAAGGIGFRGAVTATVTDANGIEQQVKWDWATASDVWISVVGTSNSNYPAGGDTLVEDAITALFTTVDVGGNVNPLPIESACYVAVPGITTLEARMKIGGAPGGGDTAPLTIAANAYADLNAVVGVTIT